VNRLSVVLRERKRSQFGEKGEGKGGNLLNGSRELALWAEVVKKQSFVAGLRKNTMEVTSKLKKS